MVRFVPNPPRLSRAADAPIRSVGPTGAEALKIRSACLYMPRFARALTRERNARLSEDAKRARAALVLLVVAVALNAAVCGMLSGPFDRYQARLLWLVPCAALLLDVARRRPRP